MDEFFLDLKTDPLMNNASASVRNPEKKHLALHFVPHQLEGKSHDLKLRKGKLSGMFRHEENLDKMHQPSNTQAKKIQALPLP